jgi:hypothetical protein
MKKVTYFVTMHRSHRTARIPLHGDVGTVGVVVDGKAIELNGNATLGGFTHTPFTVRSTMGALTMRPEASNSVGLDTEVTGDPWLEENPLTQVELEARLEEARALFVDIVGLSFDPKVTKAEMRDRMAQIAQEGRRLCGS